MIRVLRPTKQQFNKRQIYGFDIETTGVKNDFYCASVWHKDKEPKIFFDKDKCIEFFKQKCFRNSIVAATNLQFDFFGLFYEKEEIMNFRTLFRGSHLIYAKTYLQNKTFHPRSFDIVDGKKVDKKRNSFTFIDTLNYAKLSVLDIGNILGIEKLKKPKALGRLPKNETEKEELLIYNVRDSELSARFIEFLFKSFTDLGATPKLTIASTAMSLFRNKYLKENYFRQPVTNLMNQFKAYYGGRTEAFERGRIHGYYYYDINSLYPSVMMKPLPDPNTVRTNHKNTLTYIENFEGVSHVKIKSPQMQYPLLPMRTEDKLLFPCGTWEAWYTHVELRKALELGYEIHKVYHTYYSKTTCSPFNDYVLDLYRKRKAYQKDNNRMEYVVKLLLNSLYGKFGQRFIDRDNWEPFNHTKEELDKLDHFEVFGNYIRIKQSFVEPPIFTIPLWAAYITSYARLELYKYISRYSPVYVDTDSLVTKSVIPESKELGKLKLEMYIKDGIIVKPKMYAFLAEDNKEHVKLKGVGKGLTWTDFNSVLKDPVVLYNKFVKFKESIRRNLTPNEIIPIDKHISLEDTKRIWEKPFDAFEHQTSTPIMVSPQNQAYIRQVLQH